MKRVFIVGLVVMVALAGYGLYAVFRNPAPASGPIEVVPLEPATAEPAGAPEPTPEASPTMPEVEPTEIEAPTAGPTEEPAAGESPTESAPGQIYQILPAESQVRFLIDEVLNGAPNTVEGVTDQVSGQVEFDPGNPAATRVGPVLVNARTLVTDNNFRNRALQNQILATGQHEFIRFTPTRLSGLPDSVTVGEAYTLQMVGDLTVREVTQQVTFDVTVTPSAENRLQGTATATILYPDFGLVIPQARSVASVEDEVILVIDFVAQAG